MHARSRSLWLKRLFSVIAMSVVVSCSGTTWATTLQQELVKQSVSEVSSAYRPIAPWTGTLFLPRPDARDPEGGVLLEVTNSPRPELIGQMVVVRWDQSMPWDRWFTERSRDVTFNQDLLKEIKKYKMSPPWLIDGWKKVSPLESYAAGRSGEMEVLLKDPELRDGMLFITREPVEISGVQVALIRFEGASEDTLRKVSHYNSLSRTFDGPSEIVSIPETFFDNPDFPIPFTTTVDIESTALNKLGWYIFGRRENGVFRVEAIEPREPFRLSPWTIKIGRDDARAFLCHEEYQDLKSQTIGMSVVEPVPERFPGQNKANIADYVENVWPVGTKGILAHLFFAWKNPSHKVSRGVLPGGVTTGHFSLGFAEVVLDPFTGEKRFDIEYCQIYGNNVNQIFSNTQKWHTYGGNLKRGLMFLEPFSDTIFQVPELAPYDIDGWKIKPLDGLRRELEKMMALYRNGAGGGIATIRPDMSCVQDTSAAMFSALKTLEVGVAASGKTRDWAKAGGEQSKEVRRYLSLLHLSRELEKMLTFFGIPQGRWRDFIAHPLATRDTSKLAMVLGNTLVGIKTMLPRNVRDHVLKIAIDRGYPIWSIQTVQIGGKIAGMIPVAPSCPTAPFH